MYYYKKKGEDWLAFTNKVPSHTSFRIIIKTRYWIEVDF